MTRWIAVACWVFVAAALFVAPAGAVDFRIDTRVYAGESDGPAYKNVTLFQRGIVYDFLGEPASEITIYDPRGRHFTLLDVRRKMKTRIDERLLLQFVAEMKVRALERGGPLVREAAEPQFEESYDQRLQRINLTGERLDYTARAGDERFPNEETAQEYFNFIDLYAHLNATRIGAMPPQARLELNRALVEHEMFPVSIERTFRSSNPLLGKSTVARSEHSVVWRLLRKDQELIDKAAKYRADFTAVSFGEYRQIDAPTGE